MKEIMIITIVLLIIKLFSFPSDASFEFISTISYQLPLENIHLDPGNISFFTNAKFRWKQIIGLNKLQLINRTNRIAVLTNLKMGFYAFEVAITPFNDSRIISRVVQIQIYDSTNQKPTANAGGNKVVYLPINSVQLFGSNSFDDRKITKYVWIPDEFNPAGLEILGNTNNEANLLLRNLSPGIYKFKLLVEDAEGLIDEDRMILTVNEDINVRNLIEIHFLADLRNFTYKNLKNFKSQVYLIISKSLPDIEFQIKIIQLKQDPATGHALMTFYVFYKTKNIQRKLQLFPASSLIKLLRPVILDDINIFMFPVVQIKSLNCSRTCFEHGYCDSRTQTCVCDIFWITNLWNKWLEKDFQGDCEWNIFYIISITGLLAVVSSAVFRQIFQFVSKNSYCRLISNNV